MSDRQEVVDAINNGSSFCLITHENPDGDALGSLLGTHRLLGALGKDSVMLMGADEFPLAPEYKYFADAEIVTTVPADIADRTVIFLDCGNIDRSPLAGVCKLATTIVNVDHHHDNTRFGTINLVVGDASSTGEIVWSLAKDLGVALTREIADPLYIALVTDTGKFMYENTGVAAHTMAAELIAAGVDVQAIYRELYEDLPYSKLRLLERALRNVRRYEEGALTLTYVSLADFAAAEATESDSEGIVDHLRAVEGTKVAAMARELQNGRTRKKVSLRSTDGTVDVSIIARESSGGGHRQAAGFSTDLGEDELIAFLRAQISAQLS
ncbi:MAG TPA: bifunctional oligoribonuclease/PAP phosphatase NrnA [Baekduia sp.]|nr:bifunctional oligoribonuclease/PAP phosphatase NrnA [Baekduia sp.]